MQRSASSHSTPQSPDASVVMRSHGAHSFRGVKKRMVPMWRISLRTEHKQGLFHSPGIACQTRIAETNFYFRGLKSLSYHCVWGTNFGRRDDNRWHWHLFQTISLPSYENRQTSQTFNSSPSSCLKPTSCQVPTLFQPETGRGYSSPFCDRVAGATQALAVSL